MSGSRSTAMIRRGEGERRRERAGQRAGAGANLDHDVVGAERGGAHDPLEHAAVDQEVLAPGFLGVEIVLGQQPARIVHAPALVPRPERNAHSWRRGFRVMARREEGA